MAMILLISTSTALLHVLFEKVLRTKSPRIFMYLHQGRVSEEIGWTRVPYTIFFFLAYSLMIGTGIMMFKAPWKKEFWRINSIKRVHGVFGMLLFAVLLVCAVTGVAYRFCRVILNMDKKAVGWLLTIHAFKYSELSMVIFVHLMFIMVAFLVVSGSYAYLKSWYSWIKYKISKKNPIVHIQEKDMDEYQLKVDDDEQSSVETATSEYIDEQYVVVNRTEDV
eukprot:gene9311-1399_t